ncbi:MAG TPA: zf-HC2 domain-containing protein, partial [Pyrinomonadaceae bacterium]|nr:zf-HC2 domain-containing protein [Pyrinomonadaceae bacterium]
MRTHEEYKEMIVVQALGALEGAEARELDVHLATCDECLEESKSWQDTASSLAYAAPSAEPS